MSDSGTSREKYWSELDADEKIERVRRVSKALDKKLGRAIDLLHRTETNFVKHEHGLNGVVVEIPRYALDMERIPPDDSGDDVFF